jgi:hypothetical protein
MAALAPKKKIRKSRLLNEANARRLGGVKGVEGLDRGVVVIVAESKAELAGSGD